MDYRTLFLLVQPSFLWMYFTIFMYYNSCMNCNILQCIYYFCYFQLNLFCSFSTQKFQKFHKKFLALIQFNWISYMHCYLRRSVIPKVSSWKRNEILPSFCNFRYRNLFDNRFLLDHMFPNHNSSKQQFLSYTFSKIMFSLTAFLEK